MKDMIGRTEKIQSVIYKEQLIKKKPDKYVLKFLRFIDDEYTCLAD